MQNFNSISCSNQQKTLLTKRKTTTPFLLPVTAHSSGQLSDSTSGVSSRSGKSRSDQSQNTIRSRSRSACQWTDCTSEEDNAFYSIRNSSVEGTTSSQEYPTSQDVQMAPVLDSQLPIQEFPIPQSTTKFNRRAATRQGPSWRRQLQRMPQCNTTPQSNSFDSPRSPRQPAHSQDLQP